MPVQLKPQRTIKKKVAVYYLLFCVLSLLFMQYTGLHNAILSCTNDHPESWDAPLNERINLRPQSRSIHMIYSVFGDDPLFIDEWEVSLKSVLFNAPVDLELHVHIFCNGSGNQAVSNRLLNVARLSGTKWRNPIQITVTTVESHVEKLLLFLESMLNGRENMDERLGIGAFFRLFAHKFIVEYMVLNDDNRDLHQFLYLDVDVVIMSNLNNLMLSMDQLVNSYKLRSNGSYPLWLWGQGNSGFLGMNVLEFDRFWEAAERCETIKLDKWPKKNDQWLLQHVSGCYPDICAKHDQRGPWSVHMGHGGYRNDPPKLFRQENRTVGMMHLQNPKIPNWFDGSFHRTGIEGSNYDRGYVGHFCERASWCNQTDGQEMMAVRNTWGLADYFVRIKWEWLIYQSGTSRIKPGEEGTEIELVFRDASSNVTIKQ